MTNNLLKIGKSVLVAGVKSVGLGAGVVVILGVATGEIKSLKDLDLDKLLK